MVATGFSNPTGIRAAWANQARTMPFRGIAPPFVEDISAHCAAASSAGKRVRIDEQSGEAASERPEVSGQQFGRHQGAYVVCDEYYHAVIE